MTQDVGSGTIGMKTSTFYMTANNEDISLKVVPFAYGHALTSYKIMTLKGQSSRSQQGYIGLGTIQNILISIVFF